MSVIIVSPTSFLDPNSAKDPQLSSIIVCSNVALFDAVQLYATWCYSLAVVRASLCVRYQAH